MLSFGHKKTPLESGVVSQEELLCLINYNLDCCSLPFIYKSPRGEVKSNLLGSQNHFFIPSLFYHQGGE